jgi:hypothetical protein
MRFDRRLHKVHSIDNQKIAACYDRFSTRFSLSVNQQQVYSRLLL